MSFAQACEMLKRLGLIGMAQTLEDMQASPAATRDLSLTDLIIKLGESEESVRSNRRLRRLLKASGQRQEAFLEDINFRTNRGLDRQVIANLTTCDWVTNHQNLFLTGPTGVGKTWLAEAFVAQACRKGLPAVIWKVSKLLSAIHVGRGDGSGPKLNAKLERTPLLVLDDWGRFPLTAQGRQDLLELVDDRCGRGSIVITSQLPVDKWYDWLNEPTIADALLDRIVHSAHRIDLKGESMRAQRAKH